MPIISKFYGIIIKMFFQQKEHNPPHIHAIYGEYAAIIDIQKVIVIEGDLPPKAQAMVIEWTEINKKKNSLKASYFWEIRQKSNRLQKKIL